MGDASRNSIKNEDTYDALRDDGYSKETAARIANARANGSLSSDGRDYEDRTKDGLYDLAQDRGIAGRSDMTKDELIKALRDQRSTA